MWTFLIYQWWRAAQQARGRLREFRLLVGFYRCAYAPKTTHICHPQVIAGKICEGHDLEQ